MWMSEHWITRSMLSGQCHIVLVFVDALTD